MLKAMKLIVAIVMVALVALTTVSLPSYAQDAQTQQKLDSGVKQTPKPKVLSYSGVLAQNATKDLEVLKDSTYCLAWRGNPNFLTKVSRKLKNTATGLVSLEVDTDIPAGTNNSSLVNTNEYNQLILKNKSSNANASVAYYVDYKPRSPFTTDCD